MGDRSGEQGPELSPRERQLLRYASEGMTDSGIARKLGISEATVGTYWGRVRIKLGPHSRTELVAIMLRSEHQASLEALREENRLLTQTLKIAGPDNMMYSELLKGAADAIILVTAEGTIEYANEAAADLFGYSVRELEALNVADLIPEGYRNRHSEHREEYVRDPQRRPMGEHLETPALHRSGRVFRIRAALSALASARGLVVMCVIRGA